jgi:hypothetical protein
MTNALGIAAVTATLRELLRNRIVEQNIVGILGVSVTVSAVPPDRVIPESGKETSQLNLFMHRVSANSGWRNEGLPARDPSGRQRLANTPLPLDLHYLLTAYCADDLHGDVLLGFAMQWLHARPVLTREMIRAALTVSSPPGSPLERALAASGLADQIEVVKIVPEYLDSEEMSKLWTATQTNLRPSAAYKASVLLIETEEPVHSPLPVLTRGVPVAGTGRDEGIRLQPDTELSLPTLEMVEPVSKQPVVRLGEEVALNGRQLGGIDRMVLLSNDRFQFEQTVVAAPGNDVDQLRFTIPTSSADDFPVGIYRVGVRLTNPEETTARESNRLALTVAPEIIGLPLTVIRDGSGTVGFTLHFQPAVRAGQRVALILGMQEYQPQPFTAPAVSLDFAIEHAPAAPPPGLLVRLRIDGIDSPIVDRTVSPPRFLNQRIIVT